MKTRLALLLAVAAACAPRLLPGTDVKDTPDTRAIYDVIQKWVNAMNARDVQGVLALVAPDYFDDAGTPDPSDDMDRGRLEKSLTEDLARVEGAKLAVTIRRIDVDGANATAELYYDSYYRVQTPAGPIPRRDSDVYRLKLKKVDGAWKIASGL
ncbi:MAG TPA: nuclear transport factor 2 family protein [Anaeromyxobacter sp.]